jgi:NDP-sugar pyrophosphorylase family protein
MKKKIKQILILNGGTGTRVKSISKGGPKCLIKICNKTFLYLQLGEIKRQGIKDIVISCGYKSQMIIDEIKKKYIKDLNLNIKISTEKKKLGTGGAILNAYKYLDDCFFVTYGDSWLNVNYKAVGKKFINSKKSSIMTLINVSSVKNHRPNILLKNDKIVSYKKNNNDKSFKYIDYGLIAFKKNIFLNFKKNFVLKKFDLKKIIKGLIKKNELVGHVVKKKFYTIGTPEDIFQFRKIIKKVK